MNFQHLWTALVAGCLIVVACSDDDSGSNNNHNVPTAQAQYFVGTTVAGSDGDELFYRLFEEIPSGTITLDEFDRTDVFTEFYGGRGYGISGSNIIKRFRVDGLDLVEDGQVGVQGTATYLFFLSETRAFTLNRERKEVVEWNPTTMTITDRDPSTSTIAEGIPYRDEVEVVDGFESNIRRGFVRENDRTLFMHIAYQGAGFLNEMAVMAVDLDSGEVVVSRDPDCPVTAGFGGFFDDNGDLYLFADSFARQTRFPDLLAGQPGKPNCIVRIAADSRVIDTDFELRPGASMQGQLPFGLSPIGGGLGLVLGLNLPRAGEFEDLFDLFGAPIHEGWAVDVRSGEVQRIADLVPGGVTDEASILDGRLFLSRTSGDFGDGGDLGDSNTVFWEITPTLTATAVFTVPGFAYASDI